MNEEVVSLSLTKESIAEIITGLNELTLAGKGNSLTHNLKTGLLTMLGTSDYKVVR